jgi:hypothetical protein
MTLLHASKLPRAIWLNCKISSITAFYDSSIQGDFSSVRRQIPITAVLFIAAHCRYETAKMAKIVPLTQKYWIDQA